MPFNKPFYEKKLWDDRFIDFKSLSLRSIVDIGTSIATAVVSTVVTAVVPAAGIPLMMATAALTAGISLTDDIIFSIDFMATDGDFFNEDSFWGGLNPGSIVMGMVGNFVQFSLDEVNLPGYPGMNYKQGQILHRTTGTGINASLKYGIQGATSLNLLNFSDFFIPFSRDGMTTSKSKIFNSFAHANVGLLQLNLGQDAITAGIGMGGHRMNAGAIVHSIKGLDIYRENARIARSDVDDDLKVAMRAIYS